MFRNAKVGDKVWSMRNCWGTIVEINPNYGCPLRVEFNNCDFTNSFTMDGKEYVNDINPTLFWNEIKYETPKKPFNLEEELRKLEIAKFELGSNNYTLLWSNQYSIIDFDYYMSYQNPLTVYFTKKSIMNFLDSIKDKGITKEEFFEAYKNVFGGK